MKLAAAIVIGALLIAGVATWHGHRHQGDILTKSVLQTGDIYAK